MGAFCITANAQTDSTDLTLSTTTATLTTQMDSLLFLGGNYQDYHLAFTVSDTTNFGSVSIELSSGFGQLLYRHSYDLAELQATNLIDNLWLVDINFGKFESTQTYKISLVINNYAGVSGPNITKQY